MLNLDFGGNLSYLSRHSSLAHGHDNNMSFVTKKNPQINNGIIRRDKIFDYKYLSLKMGFGTRYFSEHPKQI